MAVIPLWRGRIDEAGKLVLFEAERPKRRAYLRSLAGLAVEVIVRRKRVRRSVEANNYYWAEVLARMSTDGSDGDQSPEEIHDAMCEMFLPDERKRIEFFNRMTGECISVSPDTRRTSKLKGDEFYVFVEKVRKFALEFMGVRTEDPDPQYWRRKRSREAA